MQACAKDFRYKPYNVRMDTLFTEIEDEAEFAHAPLAVRMRPRTLDELVGQEEACGPGSWLRTAIERDALPGAAAVCQVKAAQLGESIGDIAALSLAATLE